MKYLSFIIITLFLITSCKKEKKINRNLWKNGGKWKVVKYEEIVTSTWEANEKNIVVENAGIFQFEKDDSGWQIESDGAETQKINFKYSNTSSELTLDYYEYGTTDTYDLEWEKNSFVISQVSTNTYTPGNTNLEITDVRTYRYTCEKE